MGSEQECSAVRRCTQLSPREADELFFPGRGGKPHKASTYCSTCPFLAKCLSEAIEFDLEGFFAGTTKDERKAMAPLHDIRVRALVTYLPPEPDPTARVVYRKVFTAADPHRWMDEVEPDPVELLLLEATG